MAETPTTLESVVASACLPLGLRLVDLELHGGTLKVVIEHPESELDLDGVAAASKAISFALDAHEDITPKEHYVLEVSTPGVERRLRRADHYRHAVGESISVRLTASEQGNRRLEGLLVAADDDGIELELEGTRRRVLFSAIERAHTNFDWRSALANAKHEGDGGDVTRSRRAAKRHHARGETRTEREQTR